MYAMFGACSTSSARARTPSACYSRWIGAALVAGALGGNSAVAVQLPPPGGTVIYVSTSGSDANPGTQASPVQTIQKGVKLANDANRAGRDALVSIAAGTYREVIEISSLSTTKSLTLQGAGDATILTGADDWSTGWTANPDGTYVHAWPYKWGAQPLPPSWGDYWNWDRKGYLRDRLLRSEMVYVDGNGLLGRLNLAELSVPGTFYVDEPGSRILIRPYVGTTLSTAKIEVAVRSKLVAINTRSNVVVKNLIVEKGRGSVQTDNSTMFEVLSSKNIVLEGLTLRLGAGGAFSGFYSTDLTIRRTKFIDNGVKSLEISSSFNVTVEDSEIAGNNWRGWDAEHKGFASNNKFLLMRGLTVRRVKFVNNFGHGMWLDYDNKNVLVDQIFSAKNKLRGFYNEANQGPVTVQNSKFCQNEVSGISTASGSSNFNLINNQSFDNLLAELEYTGQPRPITIKEWDSGQSITLGTTNHNFQGNVFVGYGTPQYFSAPPEGWIRWGPDQGQLTGWLATYKGDNNKYYHRNANIAFAVGAKGGADAVVRSDFQTWRTSYANDASNVNKNNEVNSTWGDSGGLSCTPSF
jgi:parallel beta helix pectate lyase-like protein